MKQRVAKIVLRIVGTLIGLMGIFMLCPALLILFRKPADLTGWMVLFIVFPILLAFYFMYVAYVTWSRFSPVVVRHVCGTLGFFLLLAVSSFLEDGHGMSTRQPLIFLSSLILIYFVYRLAAGYINRLLFPA